MNPFSLWQSYKTLKGMKDMMGGGSTPSFNPSANPYAPGDTALHTSGMGNAAGATNPQNVAANSPFQSGGGWGEMLGHMTNNSQGSAIAQQYAGAGAQAPESSMQGLMGMARRTGQQPYQEFGRLGKGRGGIWSNWFEDLGRV